MYHWISCTDHFIDVYKHLRFYHPTYYETDTIHTVNSTTINSPPPQQQQQKPTPYLYNLTKTHILNLNLSK